MLGAAFFACGAGMLLGLVSGPVLAAAAFAALGGALVVRAAGANTVVQLLVEDQYRAG